MAVHYIRKMWNELCRREPDAPLSVPLCIDSKSAIDAASSSKETENTRHIRRRVHYFRDSVANGETICYKIPGEKNWTNGLTKPLSAAQLNPEAQVYQVEVHP